MSATVPLAPVYDAAAVATLLAVEFTPEQLAGFGPPPEPVPGFVTFLDPGWSIVALRAAVEGKGRVFYPQVWYNAQPFAQAEDSPRYRQVRMEPLPDSTRKTFDEQVALTPADEEVLTARAVVAALVIHFLGTGERLLLGFWVRCADKTSAGSRVDVGHFDSLGLYVLVGWDGHRVVNVGSASARKL